MSDAPGTPLTPEEEADLRLTYGFAYMADTPIARLLATLDRERRERVDPDLRRENERLRAAVIEGDRRIEALRERIHPTIDGYCPKCGGGCLIGFAAVTPARDAVQP